MPDKRIALVTGANQGVGICATAGYGVSQENCADLLGCPLERVDRAVRATVRLLPSFQIMIR
jgi:hypothetical protein